MCHTPRKERMPFHGLLVHMSVESIPGKFCDMFDIGKFDIGKGDDLRHSSLHFGVFRAEPGTNAMHAEIEALFEWMLPGTARRWIA